MSPIFHGKLFLKKRLPHTLRETGCLVKEQIIIYRQHIRQPQYQQLAVEEHLSTCGEGKFYMFPFLKNIQEKKSLRKSYEDYFIEKLKPLLNKKT